MPRRDPSLRQDARWKERADELGRFTRDHGRWPRWSADDAAERSLALWRQNQRNRTLASEQITHKSDRTAYLDEVAPGWNAGRRSLTPWRERADELGRFTRDHGRWPRRYTDDAAEQSLAHWRQNQRVRMESPSVDGFDRRAYLDKVAPGWRASRRSLTPWRERADELGRFTRDHGRWPQKRSGDPAEQSLAHWRKNQRVSVRKEEARYGTSDRRAYLDEVAPGWSASRWEERADELGRFTRDHGRWPRKRSGDPAERSLARWLRDRRAEAKDVTRRADAAERHEYLDRVAPGWASTVRWGSWLERADALREFHRENGRWPSLRSKNPHELSLADWQLRQRAYVAQGANGQATARRQHLDAIVPGWEGRGLIPWEVQAAELASFVAHHQRWPSPTGPEAGERRLAEWHKVQRLKLHRSDAGPAQRERRAVLDRTVRGWAVARAGSPLGG